MIVTEIGHSEITVYCSPCFILFATTNTICLMYFFFEHLTFQPYNARGDLTYLTCVVEWLISRTSFCFLCQHKKALSTMKIV